MKCLSAHLPNQSRATDPQLGFMLRMLSQPHAIELQTHCMVAVLAPWMAEAARLPRVCPMALVCGVPPL